jgi:hypothetical protein
MMDDSVSEKYYENYAGHLAIRGVASGEDPEQTYLRRKKVTSYRFKVTNRYLGKKLSVLEIGGGCGNFIGEIHASGKIAQASLLESCGQHLDFAKRKFGINCFHSISEISGMKFDRIFMFHTFEHIRYPHQFLKTISPMLTAGGLLILEVPCSADPLLTLYKSDAFKSFYFQPMHHYTYSEDSLKYIYGNAGYKPLKFIYYQRYSLVNHLNWLTTGKPAGKQDFLGILDDEIEKKYKDNLIENKLTDTIFGVFEKK